ncbi:hypothetical protein Ocin01_14576 [Orchesella cincta]|uniref:Cilia- and flagella-associated protein 206 n=1 Tax=Orchesella cincta TaxID=48709 RepID=A0A1D2MGH6_ORCCI|nr:hypothetical protein Ocin01_14576 [Orchesella cincta]
MASHLNSHSGADADLDMEEDFTDAIDLSEDNRFNENFVNFVKTMKTFLNDHKGIDVPREFIVNIVKLAAIDPNNKFLIKQQMVASEMDRLRKIVIEKIVGMTEISRNVIRIQLYYREKYMTRDEVISVYREAIDEKVIPLMTELRASVPRHLNHYDLYYAKMVGVTIYFANMGPDTEQSVVNETQAAIEQVFQKDDISLLSSMTLKDRETELMHIISIAVGLRLFKKDENSHRYGEFIEDLAKNLPVRVQNGIKQLNQMNSKNTTRLIKYTTATQRYFLRHFAIRAGRRELSLEMVKSRQALTMVHQLLIYIKELLNELEREKSSIDEMATHHKEIIAELHKDKNSGIPNSTVYPRFMELCESWQNLVDSNVFVTTVSKLTTELLQMSDKDLILMDEFMDKLLASQKIQIPTIQEFFEFPSSRVPLDKYAVAKRMDYRPDVDPLNTNFSGFCVYSLVRGSGMLLLANPNLGIFTWKNMNFMLASLKAAIEFPRDPGSFVRKAVAIARRWPELIILLNVESEAYDITSITEADRSRKYSNVLVSKSSGTQSETHPVPMNLVEAYTWNEWELRRRGIILSKIHKCRTHGTQTHWQALKKTAQSQTYSRKSQEAQTMRSIHTTVPRSKFYFAGLRGYHCGMSPHIVELTSENPEDLHCVCETKKLELDDLLEAGKQRKKKSIGI